MPASRRTFLGTLAATAGVTAGCLGSESVSVHAAGSLASVLEETVGPAFEDESRIAMHGEYRGTNAILRMVLEKQARPDVVLSADVGLLRDRLYPDHASWDVVFGTNEVGLAYAPGTDLGTRLADGEPWYEVLEAAEDGELAVSDPNLDPLGYRAVHMLDLAGMYYDLPALRERILDSAEVEPDETRLLTGLSTGSRAVAVAYRNMAADHDLPFRRLPVELNFSDPEYADHYRQVSYTTDEGYTVRGSPMRYNAAVMDSASEPGAGREFVQFLLDTPDLFTENGVSVPDSLPTTHGETPEAIDA